MKTSLKISTILLLCIALFQSCHKDKPFVPEVVPIKVAPLVPISLNCTEFTNAVVANDLIKIRTLVDAFFASRNSIKTNTDPAGFETYFNPFLQQINSCSSNLKATGMYYSGIQIYPVYSVLSIEQTNNSQAKKIAMVLGIDLPWNYVVKQIDNY